MEHKQLIKPGRDTGKEGLAVSLQALSVHLTRRSFLQGIAVSVGATLLPLRLLAQSALPAGPEYTLKYPVFFKLSTILTAKDDLSELTADRIYEAFSSDHEGFAQHVETLAQFSDKEGSSAEELLRMAETSGLKDIALKIVRAWYTGTVDTSGGPVVVAYEQALMYRPVADGLTVPTYCNKGPLWWADTLPPGVTVMPENTPRVL